MPYWGSIPWLIVASGRIFGAGERREYVMQTYRDYSAAYCSPTTPLLEHPWAGATIRLAALAFCGAFWVVMPLYFLGML
jgi:hypothetical protein